jgi:hypothetical protein
MNEQSLAFKLDLFFCRNILVLPLFGPFCGAFFLKMTPTHHPGTPYPAQWYAIVPPFPLAAASRTFGVIIYA